MFHSPDCSPQAAAHLTRDTLNPTMLSPERYAGSYQTTTQAAHSTHGDQPKSPYGRTKLVHGEPGPVLVVVLLLQAGVLML